MLIDDMFSNQLRESVEIMAELVKKASELSQEIKSISLKDKFDMYRSDAAAEKKTDYKNIVLDFSALDETLKRFEELQEDTELLLIKARAYILSTMNELEPIAGEAHIFLRETEGEMLNDD